MDTLPPAILEWSRGLASLSPGVLFRAKLLTSEPLDAAIAADLADPSALEIGDRRLAVAAAVLAHPWSTDELAVEGATPARRRNAVRTAILLAPV